MLKRIIPFIATFAIGLIVASFFVSIIPSFKFKRDGKCRKGQQELRYENERLREENERLKAEKSFEFKYVDGSENADMQVPPPPMMKKGQ